SSGRIRLGTFSRRSGSMAARSRTSLLRVLHFAYLLEPIPIARSAEMIQTVISVVVTTGIKEQKVSATTQHLLGNRLLRSRFAVVTSCANRRIRKLSVIRGRLAAVTASRDHKACIQLRSISRNVSW